MPDLMNHPTTAFHPSFPPSPVTRFHTRHRLAFRQIFEHPIIISSQLIAIVILERFFSLTFPGIAFYLNSGWISGTLLPSLSALGLNRLLFGTPVQPSLRLFAKTV